MEPFFNILFNLETNEEIITYKKMLKKGDTYYSYYLLEPKQKPLGSFLLDFLNTDMHKRKNVEKSFDFTKMNIIKELDEKHLDEFILDMSNIDITMFDHMSETPIGESIKMNYRNGDFVVMSEISKGEKTWRFVGRFAKNGELINAIGGFWWSSYADLVNKYFNNKIE